MNNSVGLTGPTLVAVPSTNLDVASQAISADAASPLAHGTPSIEPQTEFAAFFAAQGVAADTDPAKQVGIALQDEKTDQTILKSDTKIGKIDDTFELENMAAPERDVKTTSSNPNAIDLIPEPALPSPKDEPEALPLHTPKAASPTKDAVRDLTYDMIGLPPQHANQVSDSAPIRLGVPEIQSPRTASRMPTAAVRSTPDGEQNPAIGTPKDMRIDHDQKTKPVALGEKPPSLVSAPQNTPSVQSLPSPESQKPSQNLTAVQAGFFQSTKMPVPQQPLIQASELQHSKAIMPSLQTSAPAASLHSAPAVPEVFVARTEASVQQPAKVLKEDNAAKRSDRLPIGVPAPSNSAAPVPPSTMPLNVPPPSGSPTQSTTSTFTPDIQGKVDAVHSLLAPTDTPEILSWDSPRTAAAHQSTAVMARAELAPHVARQLVEVMAQAAHRPTEIALSPQELGRVRMSVITEDGAITVNIITERPETLDLMRRHIDQLGQTFRSMGYDSINFEFGNGTHGGDETGGGSNNEKHDPNTAIEQSVGQPLKENAAIIQLNTTPMHGIDIRL